MKVLFLSNDPTIFDTGSATHARMLAYAAAIGELHIVSRSKKNERLSLGALRLYGVAGPAFLAAFGIAALAKKLVRSEGIQVVSAQDPFEYGRIALHAIEGTNAKLHVQVHTDFLSPYFVSPKGVPSFSMRLKNRARVRLAKKVLAHASGIRAVSERVKQSIMKAYAGKMPEPSVIPIAVASLPAPEANLPPTSYTFTLLAVSRLEAEKRIEDILAAVNAVKDRYPSIALAIAGEGRERARLERIARSYRIHDRVFFLGDRADARGLMKNAQAFIQASAYEGYGRTLIEAALARVPIITTDVGIVGEVFEGYRDALVAPVADPNALAAHITGLVEDLQARREYVMNAEASVRAHLARIPDQAAAIAADLARLA